MASTLDEETRKRLQDINGLDEVVSKIVTEFQANENGEETIQISVG
jgi:hypothetical protein